MVRLVSFKSTLTFNLVVFFALLPSLPALANTCGFPGGGHIAAVAASHAQAERERRAAAYIAAPAIKSAKHPAPIDNLDQVVISGLPDDPCLTPPARLFDEVGGLQERDAYELTVRTWLEQNLTPEQVRYFEAQDDVRRLWLVSGLLVQLQKQSSLLPRLQFETRLALFSVARGIVTSDLSDSQQRGLLLTLLSQSAAYILNPTHLHSELQIKAADFAQFNYLNRRLAVEIPKREAAPAAPGIEVTGPLTAGAWLGSFVWSSIGKLLSEFPSAEELAAKDQRVKQESEIEAAVSRLVQSVSQQLWPANTSNCGSQF